MILFKVPKTSIAVFYNILLNTNSFTVAITQNLSAIFDDAMNNFFHDCKVALPSHICFPIRLVFHQHLNSHIAYPGILTEPSNHTRGQFLHLPSYPLLRVL